MKALLAGKHVLLEKPATNVAEEARKIFDLAESKKLVVLEAVHYRYGSTSILHSLLTTDLPAGFILLLNA